MKHISTFIFSLAFVLAPLIVMAQEKPADTVAAPVHKDRYGLRVGVDLNRLAKNFYADDYKGFEIVADYRLTKKIYFAGEIGNDNITIDEDQMNFTAKGGYIKLGFDYNAYENWLDMENMIYVGVRYGFSTFKQTLNSYSIYDSSGYFNEVTFYPNREYSSLTGHWAEVVGGVKAEVFNNFYMGFSVRLHIMLAQKKPDNFDNLYIPGYNRTYDGSFGAGFNYTISYFIPLYKKAKVKEEAKK